jgi:hypothetical protein
LETLEITYLFNFNKPNQKKYKFSFDLSSMELIMDEKRNLPDWTLLSNNQCEHCPLDATKTKRCPIAANLSMVSEDFKAENAENEITIGVITKERTYLKKGTLLDGLLSIFGLLMATSGCPHMDFLKPMARFHLPFSSSEETLVRSLSMFLLTEFFEDDLSRFSMVTNYISDNHEKLEKVNHGIAERIKGIAIGSAENSAINALEKFSGRLAMDVVTDFSGIRRLVAFESKRL